MTFKKIKINAKVYSSYLVTFLPIPQIIRCEHRIELLLFLCASKVQRV